MGDVRRCRIVAVYASVGDGVYGDMKVVEALMMVWVESRGVCRIKEIGGEGKERKRVFPSFSFIGRFVGVRSNGRECDSISINFR